MSIGSSSLAMRMMIVTLCRSANIRICMTSNEVKLSGQYAAMFLEKIYAECDKFVLRRKYDIYKKLKVKLSRFWDRAAVAEKAYLIAIASAANRLPVGHAPREAPVFCR